jgi:hypothetical protein
MMSKQDIKKVLDRTMQDEESLDQFRADPDAVLEEYDISEEDKQMLKRGEVFDVMDDSGPVTKAAGICVCVVVVVVNG